MGRLSFNELMTIPCPRSASMHHSYPRMGDAEIILKSQMKTHTQVELISAAALRYASCMHLTPSQSAMSTNTQP